MGIHVIMNACIDMYAMWAVLTALQHDVFCSVLQAQSHFVLQLPILFWGFLIMPQNPILIIQAPIYTSLGLLGQPLQSRSRDSESEVIGRRWQDRCLGKKLHSEP